MKNRHKQVPKSLPSQPKSCHLQLRVCAAAPIVPQGGPEVPKWLPKVLPRCQNCSPRCSRGAKKAPRMSKRRHQGPQMAIPRSQRWPAAEGVALKIRSRTISHRFIDRCFDDWFRHVLAPPLADARQQHKHEKKSLPMENQKTSRC